MRLVLASAAFVAVSVAFAAPARACPDHLHQGFSTLPPVSAYPAYRPMAAPRRIYSSSSAYTAVAPSAPLLAPRATYSTTYSTYRPARYAPARYPRRYYVYR